MTERKGQDESIHVMRLQKSWNDSCFYFVRVLALISLAAG